jgi:cytoskeleton protein RodZ
LVEGGIKMYSADDTMIHVPHEIAGSPRASRVGADLRAARERLSWGLADVAARLRIRYPYLVAIEEGRLSDLPGNAYALGFLRTYAATLGLDPDEMARRFRAEAGEVNRKTELEFPTPVPDRGMPAGAVVLLGAVLAIGAYVGWYHMSGTRPGEVAVPPVPDRLAALAESPPAAVALAAPTVVKIPAAVPSAPAEPAADQAMPPLPSVSPTSAAAAVPPPQRLEAAAASPAQAPASANAAQASTNPGPAAEASDPAGGVAGIVLRAKSKASTWLLVKDHQGHVLLNKVLHDGESWTVPAQAADGSPLILTTGNAGGLDIVVDGTVAPGVGGNGVVRHDLPLDAALIKEGKLPAQTSAIARAAPAASRMPANGGTGGPPPLPAAANPQ